MNSGKREYPFSHYPKKKEKHVELYAKNTGTTHIFDTQLNML
jgi:hypothetical protein